VKSQLRAVFEKTGADRQAALVQLIAAIPAVREPD
jgi:DNA-binding CsgD family transcriptional regulator